MFLVFVILIALGMLAAIVLSLSDGLDEIIPGIMIAAACGGMAYLIFVTLPTEVINNTVADNETVSIPIYELGDGLGTRGSFGLFGGTINSEPAFMYYVQDVDGYYHLRHIEANRVRIVQDDDVSPHYEKTCRNLSTVPGWLRDPLFRDYSGYKCDDYVEYTFYVPEGSIAGSYNLDAQ